jgi:hypothetical protein
VVALVSPTGGPAAGGNTVNIISSSFTNATAVTFGLTTATLFTIISDTLISAVVTLGPSGSGSVSIRVTSLGGTNVSEITYRASSRPSAV